MMSYEKQPTKIDIINKLENVLSGSISRDEFNQWAYQWVQNFDSRNSLSSVEDEIHNDLIFLLAIDLEIEPDIYFHSDEEITEWINKIKSGYPLA